MGRGQLLFKGEEKNNKKKKKKVKHQQVVVQRDSSSTEQQNNNNANGGEVIITTTAVDLSRNNVNESRSSSAISNAENDDNNVVDDMKQTPNQYNNNSMNRDEINTKQQSTTTQTTAQQPNITTATTDTKMKRGSGHITVSGTVIMGYETKFEKEINVGDAILIDNEMRIVTMRLSNISINISSPFENTNTNIPTVFHYITKPRLIQKHLDEQQQLVIHDKSQQALKLNVFDAYQNHEVTYRERTEHGSYRYKKVEANQNEQQQKQLTRTDLLHIRSKKTSDKYC